MALSFGSIVGKIGAVAGLFAGDVVKLGSFAFHDYEVPEKILWGGKQQTCIHKFAGGRRVIDVMGQDDKEISFSGIFLGATATSRSQQLNNLRIKGDPVVLSWGALRYTVVIESVEFEYKYSNQTHFNVVCIPTQSLLTASTSQTLLGSINADIAAATGINVAAGLEQVQSAVAAIQPYANVAATVLGGTPLALNILGAVTQAGNITNQVASIANTNIGGFSSGAVPFSASSPLSAVATLNGLAIDVANASGAATILPYVTRMAKNLSNPSAG